MGPGRILARKISAQAFVADGRVRGQVFERGEANLDFDFADVQVSRRVTRNGRPAPGAEVFARPLEGQPVIASATTSTAGEYSLSDLAAGRYQVGTYGVAPVEISVGKRVVQDFELAPFDISGRVVDAVTGRASPM
jgi:hypothetical protein